MQNDYKSKYLYEQLRVLEKLPESYEKRMLISEKMAQIENKKKDYAKFKYVKHHKLMDTDIYKMLGRDLYGHFNRLLNTMNENNVCDIDKLDLSRASKFSVKKKLIEFGVLKEFKMEKNIKKKLYMNPIHGLLNRYTIQPELKKEFAEVNERIYNIKL